MTIDNTEICLSRYGTLSFFSGDDPIGASLRMYGEWAQAEIDVLLKLMPVGSTVLDIGANIGTHTLAFADRVGSSGQVIAFEPQPRVIEVLKDNVLRNKLSNVRVEAVALGSRHCQMAFKKIDYAGHVNVGSVTLTQNEDFSCECINVITIDSLNLERCDFIKCDSEGMGVDIINGALETIKKFQPIIFLECNNAIEGIDLYRIFYALGYELFFFAFPVFNKNNYYNNKENIFRWATETCLICVEANKKAVVEQFNTFEPVKCEEALIEKIMSAPRFGDETEYARNKIELNTRLDLANEEISELNFKIACKCLYIDGMKSQGNNMLKVRPDNELLQEKERIIDSILSSTSWRVTKPLRFLKRLFKRMLRGLNCQ